MGARSANTERAAATATRLVHRMPEPATGFPTPNRTSAMIIALPIALVRRG